MKKVICCSLMLAVIFAASASAEVVGSLNISNAGEKYIADYKASLLAQLLDKDYKVEGSSVKFYDSLLLMQMALSKGEIEVITAPENVGEFMLRNNPRLKLRGFMISKNPTAVAFGFLEEKKDLRDKFSKAVEDMEREGVIGILARDFITGPSSINPPAVEIAKFDDAETINVAITGDQPPLDYIAEDGTPAGFNVAMLAEIGRRLHVNIRPVIVETSSRAIALKSGRADVVFWFQVFEGYDKQPDVPEGVIVSTPYYGWNKAMLIGR